jgi:hypothetical protein
MNECVGFINIILTLNKKYNCELKGQLHIIK